MFESQLGYISFVENDHEIIADSKREVVTYWRKYVHKYWLRAKRTNPAQEKSVNR